jgi:hypothetical protein
MSLNVFRALREPIFRDPSRAPHLRASSMALLPAAHGR